MEDGPPTRKRGRSRLRQRRGPEVEANLRGKNRDHHLDDERDADQPRSRSADQEQASDDLEKGNRRRENSRHGHSQLRESTDALIHVDELEEALREENT